MAVVFFSIFVLVAIAMICGEIVMQIQLTETFQKEKNRWRERRRRDVAEAYHDAFPASPLPLVRAVIFWVLLTDGAILWVMILKSH